MTLEELRAALEAGEAVGFQGSAGQRIEAWGAGRRAGSRPVEGPRRLPKKAAQAPKSQPKAPKTVTPRARSQASTWRGLAPWLLPLLWFLVVAASKTGAAGWLPALRP